MQPSKATELAKRLADRARALKQLRVWRVLGWIFGSIAGALMAGLLLFGIALAVAFPNLPDISGLTDYRPQLPLRVYSADGVLLREFGEERRQFVPIAEIPPVMQNAVLAIEDARFYQHGGVDYLGVLRAGLANLGESRSQGASTITMQVARNFYLPSEKKYIRKLYEILLSMKIESQLSKQQILEVYLNQIFLGHRAYGFAAAAEVYFGKPLNRLSIAEAAMLAGIPKAPSKYNPLTNPERARKRQQYIIDRMLENGFITAEQHAAAKAEVLHYRTAVDANSSGEYLAEMVRQSIHAQYGDETYSRGLSVYTTVVHSDQEVAYRALRKGIMDYERRQVYRGPEGFVQLADQEADLDGKVADALSDHPDNDEVKAAVVLEASPKKVSVMLQSGQTVEVVGEGLKPVTSGLNGKGPAQVQIRRGSIVRVLANAKQEYSLTQLPEVEGAFVALDPRDGSIRALVGGFDYAKNKFNHVTQAWRQPGSSFKPFIYSAALERGFGPATVVNDAPLFFDAGSTGSQAWEPKNYDGTFDGPLPLRRALARSKNMVSIRVLQSIGPGYAQQWITRFGFEAEKHPAYLPMALGTGSVTPLQMASAYSVFANGGLRITPRLINRITDNRGRVLMEQTSAEPGSTVRTIDARNAFLMSSLLQEVTRSGTAARAQGTLKRPDLYGKTGTTNESRDAWFAGYQPQIVAIVWMGYDTPRKLGDRETGGGLALPVWIEYMQHALKGIPIQEIRPPEGVVFAGGDWYYEENAQSGGVSNLEGAALPASGASAPADDKKGILDLFRN